MESTILAANTLPHNTNVPSQALLEVIAMDGPGLVALIRAADLKVLFVNHQFHSYLGYTNADLEKETLLFTDLFVDNIQQRLLFQLNFVKDDVAARSRYVIYRLSGKDKKILPFYVYAAPVNNPEGEQYYYLTMHPDLSKWDMPFTSSNTRELFLEQFNSEDFGTFEWIIDVNKVFWSLGVYRIYEVERGQEMDIDFIAQFTHPDDRDRLKKLLDYAIENNQDLDVEYRIISAKNKVKIIHSLARVIRNSEGKRLKLAGSIRDVTEQRQIKADLENKVEELNHSNKELEEFAYVASHDMQEPLRKITTFSDRLSEKYKDVLTGDGLMYLSRMIASAENMRSLINDLLDFSRISKTAQNF